MKKIIIGFLLSVLSTVVCVANGAQAAAIYVDAPFELKAEKGNKGVYLAKATWKKAEKEKGISAMMRTSFEWKEMKFSFIPTQDGVVKLTFRNKFKRNEKGELSKNRTFFDDIHINGKGFFNSDFSNRYKNWKKIGSPKIVYDKDRGGVASTTYSNAIFRDIEVKAGVPVEISAVVKDAGVQIDEMYIDFSKSANVQFDGNGIKDGEFAPISSITNGISKDGIREFNGLNFKLANGVSAFSSLRANQKEAEYEFNTNSNFFTFLYVLHSTGKDVRRQNSRKNCGTIEIIYADGRISRFWIKTTFEAMSMFEKKIGDNGIPAYIEDKKNNIGVLYLSRYPLEKKPIKKIKFIGTGCTAWNVVGATLTNKDIPTTEYKKPDPKEWKAVDISDLEISTGSALDVDAGMGHKPAGKYGRLRIGTDGKFFFEGNPTERVKFKGTNWRPGDHFFSKIKTKEEIDVLAKMARKQGYNMIRWRISMLKQKEFSSPYQMRPEVLDMYDYFMYAMAREGVYTHLNLSSHDLGDPNFKWSDRYDVKVKMLLGDPATREAWRKLVEMQLNHVNPYSGKKWKDDPAVATTEYFNEMELGFLASDRNLSTEVVNFANAKFQAWIEKKYEGDIEKLNKAWSDNKNKYRYKKFSDVKVFGDRKFRVNRDKTLFVIESGKEFLAYCKNVVRNIEKFDAPLHQFNCGRTLEVLYMSAEGGSYMAQNVYFVHPTDFNAPDSRTPQNSSLDPDEALMYFRGAVTKRMADRPMALTEWQHCHWNPYKHEAGVVFPAFSALHDFDNLTVHDVAIEKEGKGIFGHAEVGKSPVMRANEFLSYCFFYRGDVKPSPHRVEIIFSKKYVAESQGMSYIVNSDQSRLSLLTGFSINFTGAKKFNELKKVKVKPADLLLYPSGYTISNVYNNYVEAGETKGQKFDFAKGVEILREKNILPAENITDASKHIYQSDTGEITLRLNERLAKVVTQKSEAVALKPETKNEKLGKLTVESTSTAATVAVVSVDDKPLTDSKRMVFIYSTDTTSTDFTTSSSGEYLKFRGKQPIIVKVGKLSATLDLPKSDKEYKLYALALTGKRVEEVPTKIVDGKMHISLDTSTLKKEPAVFYEIVAE